MTDTAGQRLRDQLDEALERTGRERNVSLQWDERELAHLDAAQAAADTAELLAVRLDDPELDPALVVRLGAERRLQLKAVADHVDRLSIWAEVPKSARHVKAGQARWDHWRANTSKETA
ncbi:hypothetical protein [Mycolicibacterium arenosum]|uniref:DUF222 domain-containing protein n=1 Tax=Mycolicibacterium arenosum TaxID=2952157 RepID=A0ABT1M4M1_9MYCO|nr:hypothetical protein [Mycolicibacterium sp. CAU 1645]MCP9272772.1 hypothetical protein [Mycolicibacterium sp. CAU 1645]